MLRLQTPDYDERDLCTKVVQKMVAQTESTFGNHVQYLDMATMFFQFHLKMRSCHYQTLL